VPGWLGKAVVRFPAKDENDHQAVIVCEGIETGLSIWQATGRAVWVTLGVENFKHAPLAPKASVIIAADADPDRRPLLKAINHLQMKHGVMLTVPTGTDGRDFNDVLREEGADAVREQIDDHGLVLAERVRAELRALSADGTIDSDITSTAPSETPEVQGPSLIDLTAFDLGSLPTRPWLVEGLLMDGQVSLIVAKGGVGKSALAMHVAVMCASGAEWVQ
jgi:hypothetical protein